MVAVEPARRRRGGGGGGVWPCCAGGGRSVSADALERLQGAAEVQAVEGRCSGAAAGLEAVAPPVLLSGSGHSDGLALSSSQRSLPASVRGCGATTGALQGAPCQAEVNPTVKHILSRSTSYFFCCEKTKANSFIEAPWDCILFYQADGKVESLQSSSLISWAALEQEFSYHTH